MNELEGLNVAVNVSEVENDLLLMSGVIPAIYPLAWVACEFDAAPDANLFKLQIREVACSESFGLLPELACVEDSFMLFP